MIMISSRYSFLTVYKETRSCFNGEGNPGTADIPEEDIPEEDIPEEDIPEEGIRDEEEDIQDAEGIPDALQSYRNSKSSLPPLVTTTRR